MGLFMVTINSKVITKNLLGPLDLLKAQILDMHKLPEVVRMNEIKNFKFTIF